LSLKALLLVVTSVALAPACGGGDGGTMAPALCLSFTGAQPPAPGRVAARAGSGGSCAARSVELVVTDVSDVFSGSFTVTFDPARVSFGGASAAGSLLAAGGTQVNVVQTNAQPGSVTIGIGRIGSSTGVNVTGSQVLVRLTFAPVSAGTSALGLTGGQLFGSQTPPQPKSGLTFTGGTFTVQ
jgi:hypothetical protein